MFKTYEVLVRVCVCACLCVLCSFENTYVRVCVRTLTHVRESMVENVVCAFNFHFKF